MLPIALSPPLTMSSPGTDSYMPHASDHPAETSSPLSSNTSSVEMLLQSDSFTNGSGHLDPVRRSGQDPMFVQLELWLTAAGFNTSPNLPAAFEIDGTRHRQQPVTVSSSGSLASNKELSVSGTVVNADPDPDGYDEGPYNDHGRHLDSEDHLFRIPNHGRPYVCGLRHDIFQSLVENVRQMLTDRSNVEEETDSRSYAENLEQDFPTTSRFSIQESDIPRIVARVIRVMEALHHASILSLAGQTPHDGAAKRRSMDVLKAILPRGAKEADTATTFTVPQTYITPMDSAEQSPSSHSQPPMYEGMTMTTTLVSHSTVMGKTEISWTSSQRGASLPHAGDNATAPHVSAAVLTRNVGHYDDITEVADTPTSRRASAAETASRAHVEGYPLENPSVRSSQCCITSFPALRVRHCTNDWIIPPVATPGFTDRGKVDLYNVGIDAHTGPGAIVPSQSTTERCLSTPAITAIDFSFTVPRFGIEKKRVSDGDTHKLRVAIGKSAGRRRSHNAPTSEPLTGASSMLQKLRQGSVQIGQALRVGGSGHAHQTIHIDQGRRASSMDQMKAILDKTSAHQKLKDTSHQEPKMVVNKAASRSADTCSEDGRPHLCSDERGSSYGSP